jgi:hypothetical protein
MDSRNLQMAAKHGQIENPFSLSQLDIKAGLLGCLNKLFYFKSEAPYLCRKHLQ